jgi:hypothetical protein
MFPSLFGASAGFSAGSGGSSPMQERSSSPTAVRRAVVMTESVDVETSATGTKLVNQVCFNDQRARRYLLAEILIFLPL